MVDPQLSLYALRAWERDAYDGKWYYNTIGVTYATESEALGAAIEHMQTRREFFDKDYGSNGGFGIAFIEILRYTLGRSGFTYREIDSPPVPQDIADAIAADAAYASAQADKAANEQ